MRDLIWRRSRRRRGSSMVDRAISLFCLNLLLPPTAAGDTWRRSLRPYVRFSFSYLIVLHGGPKSEPCRIINKSSSQLTPSQFIIVVSFTTLPLELCADELVVGGGVGWSYDRRRRRAAHFSSAAAVWLYWRRRRRQTGWESSETAHSLDRCFFLAYRGQPLHLWSPLGRRRRRLNCEYACFAHNFTVVMS